MRARWLSAPLAIAITLGASGRARALEWRPRGEVGWQEAAFSDGELTRARAYALAAIAPTLSEDPESGASLRLDASARAAVGLESELAIRALSLTRTAEHWQLTLGMQEVPWGETFGLPIGDLVNPHDLRDPLFLDLDWIRLPVAAANLRVAFGETRLQIVATPVPRSNLLPARGSPFDPFPAALAGVPLADGRTFPIDRLGRDAEIGGRASAVIAGGIDLSLLYFFHWSRGPVFRLDFDAGRPVAIVPVIERTHTAGLSFTKTFGDVVLRGDALAHFGQPIQDLSFRAAPRGQELQAVLGADATTAGEWTLGAQWQIDAQRADDVASSTLQWVSARVRKPLLAGDLELEAFVLRGVGNEDTWVQPKVTWHADALALSLRGDLVWGSDAEPRSLFGAWGARRRLMLIARLAF